MVTCMLWSPLEILLVSDLKQTHPEQNHYLRLRRI